MAYLRFSKYSFLFLAGIIALGGFLFLGSVDNVSASCYVCCCGDGQIVPGAVCSVSCENNGGENGSKPYTCGSYDLPDYSECTAGSDYTTIDECGGVCGDQGCNASTGICNSGGDTGATGDNCREVCDQTGCRTVCDTGVDNTNQNQLPTNVDNTKQKTTGPANVQMPNFIGVTSISGLILKITDFLIILAIPFAVLMLIWAGFQFATAQGSPDKIEKAKKNLVWTVAGIAVILASQAIISYITEILGGTGSGAGSALITKIKGTLNQIIGLLFVLVTVYFFWGIVQFVRASGSGDAEKMKTGKQHMIWGLVGMAVMLGAWGIVRMIQVFFQ